MEEIDRLQTWLGSLPEDINLFLGLASNENVPLESRRLAAGAINYLFKSVDLIPDAIDDIGFLDDVFTLRIAALDLDLAEIARVDPETGARLETLQGDNAGIRDLLGDDIYERFRLYTRVLSGNSARGRKAADIVSMPGKLAEVRTEVSGFCKDYKAPLVEKSQRSLVKLRSFLDTRLPR